MTDPRSRSRPARSVGRLRRAALAMAFAACASLLSVSPATSQSAPGTVTATEPIVHGISQHGGDARQPDVTVIDSSIATPHDRITVYRTSGTFEWSSDWRRATNFDGSIWTFDTGATGRPQLAIEFSRSSNGVEARIYPELARSPAVGEAASTPMPPLLPARAALVVRAPSEWYRTDGSLSPSLDLELDGPMSVPLHTVTGPSGESGLPIPPEFAARADGSVDWTVQVRQRSDAGLYEVWRTQLPVPDTYGFFRTFISVQPRPVPIRYDGTAFWSLVGSTAKPGRGPNETHPPIAVDWRLGKVTAINQFLPGVAPEQGWNITSLRPLVAGAPNELDFENPFAFYDLASAHDGYPDVHVRVAHFPANDAYFMGGRFARPRQIVRYSWDQYHRNQWDFKLDLAGSHRYEDTVEFDGFSVRTVPYDALLPWIADREWDSRVLVASERTGYWTSEGIYTWDTPAALSENFLAGRSDTPALDAFQEIDPGMRGEFALSGAAQVRLYVSAIDRKLHLLGAEAGLWNVGRDVHVRYQNLGGAHLNQWMRIEGTDVTASLTHLAGQLILSTAEGASVRPAPVPPALAVALPPVGRDQWAELGALLSRYRAPFAGDDLQALFDQFAEPAVHAPGGRAFDFRSVADGFRMTLEAPQGTTGTPWFPALSAGTYAVRFRTDTGYSVAPTSPPSLAVSRVGALEAHLTALTPVILTTTLANRGSQDALDVPVRFLARAASGQETDVGSVDIDILGGESADVRLVWTPPGPGRWLIIAEVTTHADARGSAPVDVMPAPASDLWSLLTAQGFGPATVAVMLLLLGGATAFGCAGALLLRAAR